MIAKTVEIRDRATFIPALAIQLIPTGEPDRYLFGRAGYGTTAAQQRTYVILMRLGDGRVMATCDPYDWDTSTMKTAHAWLVKYFDDIASGDVVDVEYLMNKTPSPKRSEREEHHA